MTSACFVDCLFTSSVNESSRNLTIYLIYICLMGIMHVRPHLLSCLVQFEIWKQVLGMIVGDKVPYYLSIQQLRE